MITIVLNSFTHVLCSITIGILYRHYRGMFGVKWHMSTSGNNGTQCWLEDPRTNAIRHRLNTKAYTLINLGVKHANKPCHKEMLVGDGLQHRRIDARRGWVSVGGKVMLTTYLTNLRPSASYLTEKWETFQGVWLSRANVDMRYNTTFPMLSPWVGSLKYYGLYGTTYYTKAKGGQSTIWFIRKGRVTNPETTLRDSL